MKLLEAMALITRRHGLIRAQKFIEVEIQAINRELEAYDEMEKPDGERSEDARDQEDDARVQGG